MPALHCAHVLVDAPTAEEYVPTGQALHVNDMFAPRMVENVPATHGSHDVEPADLL